MRKSVELRKQTGLRMSADSRRQTVLRRRILAVVIITLILLDALFISYMRVTGANKVATQQAAIVQQKLALQRTLAARITTARAREASARNLPASASQANQQPSASSTANCDVTNPMSLTVIVNKKHCIDPVTWVPPDLTQVDGFPMRAVAAAHMASMQSAAAAAGVPFDLTSGYRSYTDQVAAYNQWVTSAGSTMAADNDAARPGFSEHQTGLAADIKVGRCALVCVSSTPTYTWLQAHAAEYGFIQRYQAGLTPITGYSTEPWHWRYIGSGLATMLKKDDIVTLEAYFGVTGGDYAN